MYLSFLFFFSSQFEMKSIKSERRHSENFEPNIMVVLQHRRFSEQMHKINFKTKDEPIRENEKVSFDCTVEIHPKPRLIYVKPIY